MTQEQLKKIAWLNRAFHAEKAAKAWLAKLERDRSIAERISRCSSGTGNATGNSTENCLIRLAETKQKTQEKLAELVRIREEITQAIAGVQDDDMQTILVRHYLVYETFEVIAERMNYDERTIRRKHKKALDKIVLQCPVEMC